MSEFTDSLELSREEATRFHDMMIEKEQFIEQQANQLRACKLVLEAALGMGGVPDLFWPDVEAHGMVPKSGEGPWETWLRYANEIVEAL